VSIRVKKIVVVSVVSETAHLLIPNYLLAITVVIPLEKNISPAIKKVGHFALSH